MAYLLSAPTVDSLTPHVHEEPVVVRGKVDDGPHWQCHSLIVAH
jgi:hypothetical protein